MATPRNSPRSPSSPTSPRQTHQKTVPWDAEIDSDALFSSHTIDEIRALENKTRLERQILSKIRQFSVALLPVSTVDVVLLIVNGVVVDVVLLIVNGVVVDVVLLIVNGVVVDVVSLIVNGVVVDVVLLIVNGVVVDVVLLIVNGVVVGVVLLIANGVVVDVVILIVNGVVVDVVLLIVNGVVVDVVLLIVNGVVVDVVLLIVNGVVVDVVSLIVNGVVVDVVLLIVNGVVVDVVLLIVNGVVVGVVLLIANGVVVDVVILIVNGVVVDVVLLIVNGVVVDVMLLIVNNVVVGVILLIVNGGVVSSFPILQRQWAAISHFKESILQGSRALLKDATQTDEATADALCSILLLEESSPRQVFSEFLLARKSALQEIFHPSQHATSIKSQICEVVRVIRTSLYQIYTLFMYGLDGNSEIHEIKDNPSLLFQVLYKVTRRERSDPNSDEEALEGLFGPDFDLVTSARYLPKTVLGYRPHMRSFPATIPLRNIQANCEEWINMCLRDVSSGVAKLLKYIGTLKGLATIRDAIWNLLKEAAAAQASSDGLTWEDLCRTVLNKDMCLWDTFLRPLFSERAKTILRGLFNATVSSSKNMVTKSMDDLSDYHHTDPMVRWDRDLAGYVWHESANDGPLSILSVGNNATKDKDGGGLTLKSLACTPSIVSLCSSINDKLSVILEDAQYLIADPKPDNASPATPKQSIFVPPGTPRQSSFAQNEAGHQSPFDRYKDSSKIQTFLQDACFTAFNELLAFIDQLFTEHKSKLESDTSLCYDTTCIDRVLFMGRLCRAVPTQCTHLKHVMQGVVTQTESTPSRGTPRLTRSSSVARRKSSLLFERHG
ncbi:predicted protein [Nematostella vectensis]|uniref:Conserved oligomeric Golgi complex subunit 1 n=1 Tax=Nematostella vectensis TaxID=45351 RepID=A7SV62_NEMVE|nr:predicted protein [Nematostella vectensis]|eukprot:XP_001624516.1 predicted protein [Nematostella vectensis]